jgi:hypothetical protein
MDQMMQSSLLANAVLQYVKSSASAAEVLPALRCSMFWGRFTVIGFVSSCHKPESLVHDELVDKSSAGHWWWLS